LSQLALNSAPWKLLYYLAEVNSALSPDFFSNETLDRPFHLAMLMLGRLPRYDYWGIPVDHWPIQMSLMSLKSRPSARQVESRTGNRSAAKKAARSCFASRRIGIELSVAAAKSL
jgi:hypothetical protein